jgi:uncharacterized delta-60 repeat protein
MRAHYPNPPFIGRLVAIWSLAALFPATSIAGTTGALDPTFGDNGRARTGLIFSPEDAIAQQSSGKLLIGGNAFKASRDMAIVRLEIDGSLDKSFGADGVATIDFFGFDDRATSLIVQPDGKIVVAGSAGKNDNRTTSFALARVDTNGALDPSFGDGGRVVLDLGERWQEAAGVVSSSVGHIIIAGEASTNFDPEDADVVFARFRANGTLDDTFGTGTVAGVSTVDSGMNDYTYALLGQPDGKYVACGARTTGYWGARQSDMQAMRVNANGTVDLGFGTNGIWHSDLPAEFVTAADCAIEADGTIVLVGAQEDATIIARVRPDGVTATSRGNAGFSILEIEAPSRVSSMVMLADGSLALTGYVQRGADGIATRATYVARVEGATDSLDRDFGHHGVTLIDFGTDAYYGNSYSRALLQQADGKLVVAGANKNDAGIGGWHELVAARVDPSGAAGHSGFIGFAVPFIEASEDLGIVTLAVRRTGGSRGPVTVDYDTLPQSASSDDFTPARGTLTWMSGEMDTRLITVQIAEDLVKEGSEDLLVRLMSASGGRITWRDAQIWITDFNGTAPPATGLPAPPSGNRNASGGGGALGLEILFLLAAAALTQRTALRYAFRRRRRE